MPKKKTPTLARQNKILKLENANMKAQQDLRRLEIQNGLSNLVTGAQSQTALTSFIPALQNNIYAPLTINFTLLMYMYKTHGTLQTAIDMPVLDALRGGLELESKDLDADDLDELELYLEEKGVLDRVGDAMIWARLFGGGAIVINAGDYEVPLAETDLQPGSMVEFYDASRWELGSENRIPKSGFYDFYGKRLHGSRVLTMNGKRAPYQIRWQLAGWGMSEIEKMLEDFNIYIRNKNVIYELLEEAKVDVYRFQGFKAQLATAAGTNLVQRRVEMMNQLKNFNNALMLDKEDEYEQKQLTFSGLAAMMKEARIGIASALRMPMTKLFGLSASGFNSGEDDIENYNAMVESEVRQPMRRPLRKILKIVVRHKFGQELDIDFKYKPLRVLSALDEEVVKTSKQNRYQSLYDRRIIDSKELGQLLKKDDLVPIETEASRGELEDHPAPANVTDDEIEPVGPGKQGDKHDSADADEADEADEG